MVAVKICGLNDEDSVEAAVLGGAQMAGFVFFPKSPRAVTPERAADLIRRVPASVLTVGLFVDPDDETLARTLDATRLDLIQLHGEETPERTADIRHALGLPVMKAIAVETSADLERAEAYLDRVDRLLFDARPPVGAPLPGGNARPFDWGLLKGRDWPLPWMLAGGLSLDNLAQAVRESGARAVDVSSGVEDAPGRKNPEKIRAFLARAATLEP
ncbi:MAG: phosphoribosylanthranilate isomerase [Rhodospirillales bacterium]|nr:phosphoribosylanthranilate isomerase [Rhodospirillales bacterium]